MLYLILSQSPSLYQHSSHPSPLSTIYYSDKNSRRCIINTGCESIKGVCGSECAVLELRFGFPASFLLLLEALAVGSRCITQRLLAKNLPSLPLSLKRACLCLDSYMYLGFSLAVPASSPFNSPFPLSSLSRHSSITFFILRFIMRKYCLEFTCLASGSFWM